MEVIEQKLNMNETIETKLEEICNVMRTFCCAVLSQMHGDDNYNPQQNTNHKHPHKVIHDDLQ